MMGVESMQLHGCAVVPPGTRLWCQKAEGKIKGGGTPLRQMPVCTWGLAGTGLETGACHDSACIHVTTILAVAPR